MRITKLIAAIATVCISSIPSAGFAQLPTGARIASVPAEASPKQAPKFTFILFWKENDANTQQLTTVLKLGVAKRSERAEWKSVNLKDSTNLATVEKYGVSRAPMPLVLCIAPNGAVTSVFMKQLNDQGLERALVTPVMADVTKALQENKIVVLHLKPASNSPLPDGATEFIADPDFKARTTTIGLVMNDPAESRFLADMEIKPAQVSDSHVVVMAPPGVLVGRFAATATKSEIAAKLHAAGKCCDDPNCKHNQKAPQQ